MAPNISLLYSFTQAYREEFDYIIVEPAVTDADWLRLGYYDRASLDRNFRRFLDCAMGRWRARIIVAILPTAREIDHEEHSPRTYYRTMAKERGLLFVDFYSVYENLFVGNGDLRPLFFEDPLHVSSFVSEILADVLAHVFEHAASLLPVHATAAMPGGGPGCVLAVPTGSDGRPSLSVERRTSTVRQSFVQLGAGQSVEFSADGHSTRRR